MSSPPHPPPNCAHEKEKEEIIFNHNDMMICHWAGIPKASCCQWEHPVMKMNDGNKKEKLHSHQNLTDRFQLHRARKKQVSWLHVT